MQSALISSSMYGGIITVLFSGYIADRYGPTLVGELALIIFSMVTMLSPILAEWSYFFFLLARFIYGLASVSSLFK